MTFARPDIEALRARLEQERDQRRAASRAANMAHLVHTPVRTLHAAVMTGGTRAATPKSKPYRDRILLDMAKGRPCLVLVKLVSLHPTDTTVAAHSNLAIHGKGLGQKASDVYSVWSCFGCHSWLDQGKATSYEKGTAFMEAHLRQVLEWRRIAEDKSEPLRFRNAARRALEYLNAIPSIEGTP